MVHVRKDFLHLKAEVNTEQVNLFNEKSQNWWEDRRIS